MKKYSLMLLLLFVAMPVYAQSKAPFRRPSGLERPQQNIQLPPSRPTQIPENDRWNEPGTVIDGYVRYDFMAAPMFKFTQLNDEFGFLIGGRVGWIINSRYLLGLEGYWLANDVSGPGINPDVAMKYGGLTLEYLIRPQNLVHFSFSLLNALGSVVYDYDVTRNDDTYWVVEPAFNVYMKMTKYIRLGFGAGYRWVSDVDLDDLDEGQDLSGVAATLSINFGTDGDTLVPAFP